MIEPPVPVVRNRAADTAVTAVGGVAVLLGAALMGVLIARRFGASASTDGFFVANALYGVFLILAHSLRMTAVPRLIGGDTGARFRTELRGIALVFAGSGALFAAAGVGLAPLVASGDALRAFQVALVVLWPAVGLHLFAGLGAAMLATWDDYRGPALAFVAGAAVNVAAFLALTPPLGVYGIPGALAVGAAVSAGLVALALRRKNQSARGEGPTAVTTGQEREESLEARGGPGKTRLSATWILLGGVPFVATQIAPLISVAFAGTDGEGRASLYWYAAMLLVLLNAALASPISIVFAPVVARDFSRDRAAAAALTLRAFRATSTLAVPAVAALCLLGPEPAEWLLTKLSGSEIDDIFTLLLVLSPALLAAQLMTIPLLVVLAEGRVAQLAKWSVVVLAGHTALTAAAAALDLGLVGIAVVATISAFVLGGTVVVLGMRAHALSVARGAAKAVGAVVVPALMAFLLPALVLGGGDNLAKGAAAWLMGTLLLLAWLRIARREELDELIAVARAPRTEAAVR
jgi:peptidoglycan biosynthesis protein MviN/MurJ (putative lipid II flippase)